MAMKPAAPSPTAPAPTPAAGSRKEERPMADAASTAPPPMITELGSTPRQLLAQARVTPFTSCGSRYNGVASMLSPCIGRCCRRILPEKVTDTGPICPSHRCRKSCRVVLEKDFETRCQEQEYPIQSKSSGLYCVYCPGFVGSCLSRRSLLAASTRTPEQSKGGSSRHL